MLHNLECADSKDTPDEVPLIAEEMQESSTVYPMQTISMNPSSNGHHELDRDEGEREVDTVTQDYIDQVAATNLVQRRTNFVEATELAALAIPEYPRSGSVSISMASSGNLTPGSHNTVRVSPATSDASSLPPTPRSALKRVSQIPEPPLASEQLQADVAISVQLDNDIEKQQDQMLKSEKELNQAKKQLRLGFVEFYRGLGLLSNFRYIRIYLQLTIIFL